MVGAKRGSTWQERLLSWYEANGRSLPWRETRDPYAILVSEVMLQQTQVDRVIPRFKRWLERFPDWASLGAATRAEVLREWSGLGYNNRAARLHALARVVADQGLPEDEERLRSLPGIGRYTAGAIRAFAFDEPGRAVDVNVERVLGRLLFTPRATVSRKRVEQALIASYPGRARDFANALMDFGSAICRPKPRCGACPLRASCANKGPRPDEVPKQKQAPFMGSNRWWRGRILRALMHGGRRVGTLERELAGQEGKDSFYRALESLRSDGLVNGERLIRLADAGP